MKPLHIIVLGLGLILLALWGGSFAASLVSYGHWAHFPIVMTSVLMGLIGGVAVFVGVALADQA